MDGFNPHPYQARGIRWIKEHEKCGLFLPMGAGKTATTLKALEDLKLSGEFKKCLIIAPKRVAESTWPAEIKKWNCRLSFSLIAGTPKKRADAVESDVDVYLIGKDNLCWLADNHKWKWDMVIIDELSCFKNPQAKRFKALKRQKYSRFVGLTGTPAPKGIPDLWSQIYLMDKGKRLGSSLTRFRDGFLKPGRQNGHVVYEWLPKDGAKEEIERRLSDICMSISQSEYATLPDVQMIDVPVDLGLCLKKYRDFKRESVIGENITAINAGVLSGKLLQFCSGEIYDDDHDIVRLHDAKIQTLKEMVETADNPVLIFYWFAHEEKRIREALKGYTGMTIKDKGAIDKWNSGKLDYLLLQPASAGHGLNLQEGGHVAIWYSPPNWNLELYQQANARIARQGQKKKVVIYHLLCRGTIEEDMIEGLKRKEITQDDILRALRK